MQFASQLRVQNKCTLSTEGILVRQGHETRGTEANKTYREQTIAGVSRTTKEQGHSVW